MDDEHDAGHRPDQHHQHHHADFDSPEVAALAEREAEVLVGLLDAATARLAARCERGGAPVRRILDLGCGPGVGTSALAQRFPDATVLAVDASPAMLERVRARADRLDLGRRIEARQLRLPDGIDELEPVDVAWASMVVHHLGDEAGALARIAGCLRPGGLLALTEHGGPIRTVPDEVHLGRPGLWSRLDAAWASWFERMRAELPGATPSGDYEAMLGAVGFEHVSHEVVTVDLQPPLSPSARAFALDQLRRTQVQLAGLADPDDLGALGALLDPDGDEGILRRDDARLHAARHLYLAAVPSA